MRIKITEHAIERFMQRSSDEVASNTAHAIILNTIQPQRNQIARGLKMLKELRVPINDELLAIVVKDRNINNMITVTTVRKRKW